MGVGSVGLGVPQKLFSRLGHQLGQCQRLGSFQKEGLSKVPADVLWTVALRLLLGTPCSPEPHLCLVGCCMGTRRTLPAGIAWTGVFWGLQLSARSCSISQVDAWWVYALSDPRMCITS